MSSNETGKVRISDAFLKSLDLKVPYIRHCAPDTKISIVWKNIDKGVWYSGDFFFPKHGNHPSEYSIDIRMFNVNGFANGKGLSGGQHPKNYIKVSPDPQGNQETTKIDWNEWEVAFEEFLNDPKKFIPKNTKELRLALWEIWLQTHDSFMTPFAVSDKLYNSLNPENDIDKRVEAIEAITAHIRDYDYFLHFERMQTAIIERYPYWIEEYFASKNV